jgi:hypothetical protein
MWGKITISRKGMSGYKLVTIFSISIPEQQGGKYLPLEPFAGKRRWRRKKSPTAALLQIVSSLRRT